MIKLYIQNKPKKDKKVFETDSKEKMWDYINRWLNRRNYHSHYFRVWARGNKTYIDFGDWHIFFYYIESED